MRAVNESWQSTPRAGAPAAEEMQPSAEKRLRPLQMQPAAAAIGQLSAELVCPYPPGIPVLWPGEQITPEAVGLLQAMYEAGCSLTGCSDPELRSLAVLTHPPA